MDFKFVGDFDFKNEDAWVQFKIPMHVLRDLVSGLPGRQLIITREEIVAVLLAIASNPETSESYREIVRSLLERAQDSNAAKR